MSLDSWVKQDETTCLLFIGVFLHELLCPSRPVSEPVLSPLCPQACPCRPRTGCSASSKLFRSLIQPHPQALQRHRIPLQPQCHLLTHHLLLPNPVQGLSLLILRSCLLIQPTASSMSPSVSHQHLQPVAGSQSLPFPSLVQHFLPPLPLAFPSSSESQLPTQLLSLAQPDVHSLSRHLHLFFFLPTALVWLPPPC